MTKDDALERLGRENPVPGTMTGPPIEPLLRRLDEKPPKLAPESRPALRRGRRLTGGKVGSALAVAVAVAVAVILVGHDRARVQPSSAVGARLDPEGLFKRPQLRPMG